MALTKRFFIALAREFRDAKPAAEDDGKLAFAVWERMVRITATQLAAQNGMFNYAKFYEACGVPLRTPTP